MLNRITYVLDSHLDDVQPHASPLDWSRITQWVLPLGAVNLGQVSWDTINFGDLRASISDSGILCYDDPAWIEGEGGLGEAIRRVNQRDLNYLRKVFTALCFADAEDYDLIPRAVELGAMFLMVHRASVLTTSLRVVEELITGVYAE